MPSPGKRPPQDGVGGELEKIGRVVGAQPGLVRGQGARNAFDFPQRVAHELVDAAVERKRPAAVREPAVDDDLELRGGRLDESAGAKFVVPVLAELGAPQARRAAAGLVRAKCEVGEFADTQAGRAVCEGKFHFKPAGFLSRREPSPRVGG